MKNYKVELLSLGAMTQIPDSQKVFGSLIYLFAKKYGDQKATALVQAILRKEIHCMISNVMPYGYVPMPQDYILGLEAERSKHAGESNVDRKKRYIAVKNRAYIRYKALRELQQGTVKSEEIFPYIEVEIRQQLRASIDSIRYDNPALESRLYSVPITHLLEVQKSNGDSNGKSVPVKRFSFYLQLEDKAEGHYLLEMLEQEEKIHGCMALGKRISQGMNLFQLEKMDIEPVEHKQCDLYLNMGMLLPDQLQFSQSIIKLFTSERRPYEMRGGWEQDFQKQYISFIAEGSVISSEAGVMSIGKSIASPFNKARDIVFGNSYLYPLG